jgi:hypothetical protein
MNVRMANWKRGVGVALSVVGMAGPLAMGQVGAATSEKDVRTYRSHVEFLANPFMEGRGPGTRGNEIAAEYVESVFGRIAIRPAMRFDPYADRPGEREERIGLRFRQPFTAGNRAELASGAFDYEPLGPKPKRQRIDPGDFSVLGFSGSGEVSATVVFVGYSIEKGGPDGSFCSYPKDAGERPLAGQIAMMLRFEPMDAQGRSVWKKDADGLWSNAAALPEKLQSALKRGAAGIILVNPPGCADPRSAKLDSTEGSARWTQAMDVPVVQMSVGAAGTLVGALTAGKQTIEQLRGVADAGPGLLPLGTARVRMSARVDRTPRTTWNVAGVLPGRGPLASQYLIIGAHYDHVGYGYTGGSRSDEYGIVHPGADDNASGASGLLLAAEMMKRRYEAADARLGEPGYPEPNLRSIMFVAFSAEEMGLIGSREFVKACPVEAKSIDAMLNMDMIGRLREGKVEVSGTGTAEGFADLLRPIFDASGLTVAQSPGGRGPSDHATFYGAGVPVLHFFTGQHEQYHTPRDTVDLINSEGAVRVVNLVCDIAGTLAKRPQQLAFTSTDKKKGEEDGKPAISLGNVKVRFGIAPGNYADGEAGVLVGEVYPGTCAGEAGILSGDRLIRWNGKEIGDVQSWMGFLAQHKPGDTVDVDVRRKGEEVRVRVTLKSRDQSPK